MAWAYSFCIPVQHHLHIAAALNNIALNHTRQANVGVTVDKYLNTHFARAKSLGKEPGFLQ